MQSLNERSRLKLISGPAVEPLTLTEAREHLRITDFDSPAVDDSYVSSLIKAARNYIDGANGWLGRCLVQQTWEYRIDGFRTNNILIPLPPLVRVDSITYLDQSGDDQTIDPTNYRVIDGDSGMVLPTVGQSWPEALNQPASVVIRFVAGFPSAESPAGADGIPDDIKQGMLLLIGNWYENREENVVGTVVNKLPTAAEALLFNYRVWA
jgi:uncharacterized phiE125 gp8 family phage protein